MRIVLMGMPGVGKGTQAAGLREALGLAHVSTGDMLRESVNSGTALGRKVRGFLDSGALVPDDVMEDLIVERLEQSDAADGFILDGFPRTLEQVDILDRVMARLGASLDRVILISAAEAEIVGRLAGRRVCPKCRAVYHLENHPPASQGVCDRCGSALAQRPDDTEGVVLERLRVYSEQTAPIAERYRERDLLAEIDGSGSPEAVSERLRAAVGAS